MTTYADPTRCPDCCTLLSPGTTTCQACRLPLTGETAVALFSTFQQADRLLAVLREARQPVAVPVGASVAHGSTPGGITPYPTQRRPEPGPGRVRAASVPQVLL